MIAGRLPGAEEMLLLAEQSGTAVLRVDAGHRITWASAGCAELDGLLLDEAVHGADLPAVLGMLGAMPAGPLVVRVGVPEAARRTAALAAVPADGGWLVSVRALQAGPRAGLEDSDLVPAAAAVEGQLNALLAGQPRKGVLTAVARCAPADAAALLEREGRAGFEDVLRDLASCLSDVVRGGDVVARGQDDDLVVLLRGIQDLRSAVMVAEKLSAAGAAVRPVCVGVTLVQPGEGLASVMARAQGALDMAVDIGPGRVMSSPPLS